jgi:hypothetical protein
MAKNEGEIRYYYYYATVIPETDHPTKRSSETSNSKSCSSMQYHSPKMELVQINQ